MLISEISDCTLAEDVSTDIRLSAIMKLTRLAVDIAGRPASEADRVQAKANLESWAVTPDADIATFYALRRESILAIQKIA